MTAALLGCGLAGDDQTGDGSAGGGSAGGGSAGDGSAGDGSASSAPRRICDGSPEIRLAIAYGGGGQILPFTSVLYELGIDFLYVDGTCHYWAQQPLSIVDEYYAWRPYREGVLSSAEELQLHDSVGYDDVVTDSCLSRPVAFDAGGTFLWDGDEYHACFDRDESVNGALRTELFDAAAAVTGPMRVQVGRAFIQPNASVYDWPLDAPIDQYLIDSGETRSFRVDDAAGVVALRALRTQAIADAEVAPGYFGGVIAIGPRDGAESYVMSMRDELPFVDDPSAWLPASATPASGDERPASSADERGDDPPTPAQCQEWSNAASIGLRQAQNAAGRSCTDDADCTLVHLGLSCLADCGYPSAVPRAVVASLEAALQSVGEETCAPFEERGCPDPVPLPCNPSIGAPLAACVESQCTLGLEPEQ